MIEKYLANENDHLFTQLSEIKISGSIIQTESTFTVSAYISNTGSLLWFNLFCSIFGSVLEMQKEKKNRKKEKKKGETISSFEILPSVLLNYYILRNNIPTFVLTHFPLRLLGLQNQDHVLNISEYSLEFDTASAGEQTQSCQ